MQQASSIHAGFRIEYLASLSRQPLLPGAVRCRRYRGLPDRKFEVKGSAPVSLCRKRFRVAVPRAHAQLSATADLTRFPAQCGLSELQEVAKAITGAWVLPDDQLRRRVSPDDMMTEIISGNTAVADMQPGSFGTTIFSRRATSIV
jgi:hypothetical protein